MGSMENMDISERDEFINALLSRFGAFNPEQEQQIRFTQRRRGGNGNGTDEDDDEDGTSYDDDADDMPPLIPRYRNNVLEILDGGNGDNDGESDSVDDIDMPVLISRNGFADSDSDSDSNDSSVGNDTDDSMPGLQSRNRENSSSSSSDDDPPGLIDRLDNDDTTQNSSDIESSRRNREEMDTSSSDDDNDDDNASSSDDENEDENESSSDDDNEDDNESSSDDDNEDDNEDSNGDGDGDGDGNGECIGCLTHRQGQPEQSLSCPTPTCQSSSPPPLSIQRAPIQNINVDNRDIVPPLISDREEITITEQEQDRRQLVTNIRVVETVDDENNADEMYNDGDSDNGPPSSLFGR